jgi:hypothetical protein
MDPKELRKFAAECLDIARSMEPEEAARLRQLAREMLDAADGASGGKQQPDVGPEPENGSKQPH